MPLERQPGFEVIGEAINGREAVERAEATKPDIAVLDIAMPNISGIEAAQSISALLPRAGIIYKRPNLLLHDPDRLVRILANPHQLVQLILAGKAHPQDLAGQAMIQQWVSFVRRPAIRPHAVFLTDYDMLMAERLVQGVDVWINTPRRPWEASGTSGMKVLVNGGLNLSELLEWQKEWKCVG